LLDSVSRSLPVLQDGAKTQAKRTSGGVRHSHMLFNVHFQLDLRQPIPFS